MKTFDKKVVFSWSNAEEAKQYIGKKGYFANKLSIIEAMVQYCRNGDQYTLQEIDCDDSLCFGRKIAGTIGYQWDSLFLPADKIKEVEEPKKWRAFRSIDEFKNKTGLDLLHIVHYRLTSNGSIVSTGYGVITDFCTSGDKTDYITIGDTSFNLNELFNYEYKNDNDDNEWQPFGVKE